MNDNHVDYKKRLDTLFHHFEEYHFEPVYNDRGKEINHDWETVVQFDQWVRDSDLDNIVEASGLSEDFEDLEDCEKAAERMLIMANIGVDKWLAEGRWWDVRF